MQVEHVNQSVQTQHLLANADSVVVVGLGDTGASCLEYLGGKSVNLIGMDSRCSPPDFDTLSKKFNDVELHTGHFNVDKLLDADLIVLSPGVDLKSDEISQAQRAGIPIVGDIELFANEVKKPVISITGSNGKSTVTALCGEMLKAAGLEVLLGGNFGKPVLSLLGKHTDIYVLELSSFQLETTFSLVTCVAVVLNISPDHMDRYDSIEDYANAKQRVYRHALSAVYNRADKLSFPSVNQIKKCISFGLDAPTGEQDFGVREDQDEQWLCQGNEKLICVDRMQLKGQHNVQNALAALALVYLAGADLSKAVNVLSVFKGLPHRFEFVGTYKNVDWINDSKGTNPGATLASISGQSKPIVLIIGGDAKGADFSVLTNAIKSHVKTIILFGRDVNLIENIVPDCVPCLNADTLIQAINLADKSAGENDMVIYSPACASFDMFENYMQRGDMFKQCVLEYFQ